MQAHAYPPSPTGFPSQSSDGSHDPAAATTRTSSQCSSQESQLLHLSRVASMQEKLGDGDAVSRKRTADGLVKDAPRGHSRTTSSVSMASTSGSRIGEVTSELKARLSYAMVKVNHGWQGHSIDEVESLASQAASPTSSSSTIPTRLSTSPALSQGVRTTHNGNHATPPASQSQSHSPYESTDAARSPNQRNSTKRAALAPPAPIQPGQSFPPPDGRPPKPGYTPTPLSHSHTASPHTPALYAYPSSQPTPRADPILFSPHQTERDRDAIEALVSMGSPATAVHRVFSPSSSAPARTRHALPTGQPRKSLPGGRPRGDEGEARRRVGGGVAPLRSSLSMPAALGAGVGRRLRDEEIERMLERAAEESSEDEGEILLPRARGVVGSG